MSRRIFGSNSTGTNATLKLQASRLPSGISSVTRLTMTRDRLHPDFEQKGTDFITCLSVQFGNMEKERQFDGAMLDDLNKLVEHREQLHNSQTRRDSDSEAKIPESPDAPSVV